MAPTGYPWHILKEPSMKLAIQLEQGTDGRWIAEVPELPGVLAYGSRQGSSASARIGFPSIG